MLQRTIFQDSSGVPSVIRWKGDTLICAFQWFRQPVNSLSWDKVAVKFSYDAGLNWTEPFPILVHDIPVNFQRPFDPTLALSHDSLRIYFSSSDGLPMGGLDSSINTYSAISVDGVNYYFEPGPRFDHPTNRVIDPAVILFKDQWHYAAPIGAPQNGAYHCTSFDGINFTIQNNYLSDFNHNWTGNFMVYDSTELRFYGSGANVWYNSSSDGNFWQGYHNTNLAGGDPSVIKINTTDYLVIYVGESYTTNIKNEKNNLSNIHIFPNPFTDFIFFTSSDSQKYNYSINTITGSHLSSGITSSNEIIKIPDFSSGIYFLTLKNDLSYETIKIVK